MLMMMIYFEIHVQSACELNQFQKLPLQQIFEQLLQSSWDAFQELILSSLPSFTSWVLISAEHNVDIAWIKE